MKVLKFGWTFFVGQVFLRHEPVFVFFCILHLYSLVLSYSFWYLSIIFVSFKFRPASRYFHFSYPFHSSLQYASSHLPKHFSCDCSNTNMRCVIVQFLFRIAKVLYSRIGVFKNLIECWLRGFLCVRIETMWKVWDDDITKNSNF